MNEPLNTLKSIRKRRTIKMISNTPLPIKPVDEPFIETVIEAAYWAPFHYPTHREHKGELSSALPFRFYILDSKSCRSLVEHFSSAQLEAGKLSGMLNTADYLIMATWTPQPSTKEELFEPSLTNMEHIAAAGAGIQNLLLAATALGRENYWSSGGLLRDRNIFELLNIPTSEILLGALFIFPEDGAAKSVVKYSPKRNKRGDLFDLYRWVDI